MDIVRYAMDLKPTYHLTLQWDANHRTRGISILEKRFYYFMSRVLKELLGRKWYKQTIPFIAFGEMGMNGDYHIHMLIKDTRFPLDDWQKVIAKVVLRAKKTPVPKQPYMQPITPGEECHVARYDAKQLSYFNHYDSVIFTPELLSQKRI